MLRKLFQLTSRTKGMLGNSFKRRSNPSMFPAGMVRRETAHQIVIKQGYLLKLPETSSRFRGSLKVGWTYFAHICLFIIKLSVIS